MIRTGRAGVRDRSRGSAHDGGGAVRVVAGGEALHAPQQQHRQEAEELGRVRGTHRSTPSQNLGTMYFQNLL